MGMRVLIVDDDIHICRELETDISRSHMKTHSALSIDDARKILKSEDIDIVILDVYLNGENSIGFVSEVKGKYSSCEVIIMTGFSTQDLAVEALRKGAIDYLEKPLDMKILNTALGRAMDKIKREKEMDFKHTILLADDDVHLTENLSRILSKEGYEVLTANDGKTGYDIINSKKVDVMICDMEMPVMSGMELMEKVKRNFGDTEVIMMTGFGDESLAIEALRKGAINYLRKPIDLEELLISIEKAAERIMLYRNRLYRSRELKINAEIVSKINLELERRIEERTSEITMIQSQLFQTSKLATLGEMAAGLAHELNQPLTGISLTTGNMKMLAKRGLLEENVLLESLSTIEGLVKRMSKIIVHIRTFARQDVQKFVVMDVNESLDNAMSLMAEQIRLNDIEMSVKKTENLPQVMGEPYQIEQVLINVIANAKDAVNEKESILSGKVKEYGKKIGIETACEKGWIKIDIRDNGIGMDEKTKEKFFEPFYTTKEVGKATGLGMSISYGIMKGHSGRIDIDSSEDKGTCISIKLKPYMED